MASTSDTLTAAGLAKCPILTGKEDYAGWAEVMKSNLLTIGCWDIVSGAEIAAPRPNPIYTSRNRRCSI